MRILVAEDEPDLARTLGKALAEEGYAVDLARTGDEALAKATAVAYDTIVLDIMMPVQDGLSVLSTLRRVGGRTPVLILTARDTVEHKVQGLNVGADDYMTKPFALTELLARVRGRPVRRRYERSARPPRWRHRRPYRPRVRDPRAARAPERICCHPFRDLRACL